jgi:hypothetical protein
LKNYYDLLEISPTATAEEVKKTFRLQIARYHPDKVHHLGKEFQEMAAVRAAELTEAYRVLSHEGRRAEYDGALKSQTAESGPPTTPDAAGHPAAPTPPADGEPPPQKPPKSEREASEKDSASRLFSQERARRDAFVRNAIVERFRHAMTQVVGSTYDESDLRGFDIACTPKSKMFARAKGPRLLVRFVARVDAASVAEAWGLVNKAGMPPGDEVCIILMATDLAPAKELAGAIAEQRRRPGRGPRVTLIPVNASVWDAHVPTDAPDVAKTLLTRLKSGG